MNANSGLNGIIINSCEYIFANNNLTDSFYQEERTWITSRVSLGRSVTMQKDRQLRLRIIDIESTGLLRPNWQLKRWILDKEKINFPRKTKNVGNESRTIHEGQFALTLTHSLTHSLSFSLSLSLFHIIKCNEDQLSSLSGIKRLKRVHSKRVLNPNKRLLKIQILC